MVEGDCESEIIVGTYEDYVVGYRVETISSAPKKKLKTSGDNQQNGTNKDPSAKERYSLEQTFAVRAHSGSVRCLAANANGSLALSAGIDEMLNLFGLKKRKLIQTSEAAINCAAFYENTHLIYGCEDGNIYIHQSKGSGLTLLKTLKGHKAAVTSIAVHPTGKVLLSLSKDNTMITWNLIKGRRAYITTIKPQAHFVKWSKSGQDGFMIAANNEVYLYNNSGILEQSIKLDKRINSIEFITNSTFVIASDSGNLEFFDLKQGETCTMKFKAHDTRIKSVKCLGGNDNNHNDEDDADQNNKRIDVGQSSKILFVTASSDGLVKLWSLAVKPKVGEPQEMASVDTGARLTCMTAT